MKEEGLIEAEVKPFPQLGQQAPDFEAKSNRGDIKLSDYRGRWVILFSHPADFTPVCTTEFIAFAEIYEELRKRGVELIGLSIDSVYSHIAWIRNIEEKMKVKISFPIITDIDMKISKMYGMLHPGESSTASVRSVFFIDPEGKIRAIIYYPMSTGRSTSEILRVIDSLQTVDRHNVATPANWKPGDPVIVPPPTTQEAAEKRLMEGYECKDWYLCKRKL
ncbi:MAG: peroxiredoxin [Candidatus Bathyarchaeia archaeon]